MHFLVLVIFENIVYVIFCADIARLLQYILNISVLRQRPIFRYILVDILGKITKNLLNDVWGCYVRGSGILHREILLKIMSTILLPSIQ